MGHETGQLDIRPLILKRMIWDIFPHEWDAVKEAQCRLGLVPDTEEGMEFGHGESDTRINRAAPMSHTLKVLSSYAAEVVSAYACDGVNEEDIPDGFSDGFLRQNAAIIFDSTYAILAHLLDTGVLEYGKKVHK
jgi:hypothetical protein